MAAISEDDGRLSAQLTVPYRPVPVYPSCHWDEPLQFYAERLASLYGHRQIKAFFNNRTELSVDGIKNGSSLLEFADWVTIDPVHLLSSTPILHPDGKLRLNGVHLNRRQYQPHLVRFCPSCLVEDLDDEEGAWSYKPYRRVLWTMTAVRACPRHNVLLQSSQRPFTSLLQNTTEKNFRNACRNLAVGARADRLECELSRFVAQRLGPDATYPNFLVDVPLMLALDVCERLGRQLGKRNDQDPDARHDHLRLGFKTISQSLLEPHYRTAERLFGRTGYGSFDSLYGHFPDWLEKQAETYVGLKPVVSQLDYHATEYLAYDETRKNPQRKGRRRQRYGRPDLVKATGKSPDVLEILLHVLEAAEFKDDWFAEGSLSRCTIFECAIYDRLVVLLDSFRASKDASRYCALKPQLFEKLVQERAISPSVKRNRYTPSLFRTADLDALTSGWCRKLVQPSMMRACDMLGDLSVGPRSHEQFDVLKRAVMGEIEIIGAASKPNKTKIRKHESPFPLGRFVVHKAQSEFFDLKTLGQKPLS